MTSGHFHIRRRPAFVWLLLAAAQLIRAAVPLPADSPDFTPKEIAQGYRDGVLLAKPRPAHRDSADAAEAAEGRRMQRKFSRLGNTRVLEPAPGETTPEAIARLTATGRYEFVEPDRLIHARTIPNDPSLAEQWPLSNTGQGGGTAGADIGALAAWDILTEAPNVIVAVIDSGMRMTHADLAANLWTNANPSSTGYTNDLHGINAVVAKTSLNSGNPNDTNGHGTHVAGTIGAVGNNGVGIAGIAWKVQLMPLRFLTADGAGTTSANIACIDYAIAHGVSVINASYGSRVYSAAEFAAIASARAAGIIFVAAAGNDGVSTDAGSDYPAAYALDNIVTVAATDRTDSLASFSNYGAGSVDLAAPGEAILSTYYSSDTAYRILGGTSMAAPHVTGALALLKARFPNDTYRQLINRLLRGTTRLRALSGRVQTGGRLNVANALAAASSSPFNDDFAGRAIVAGSSVRVRSSNVGASSETGEPAHAGTTGGATLWWSWTAPSTDTVTFDASGSAYPANVAVYTGAALNSLERIAAATARTEIQAVGGTTYQVAVSGVAGATGLTQLKIGVIPPNDAFAGAQILQGSSVRVDATTVNATRESGEPTIAGVTGGHSLWYRWMAPATARFMLAAFSTQTNTLAAVYTGTTLAGLALVGSNNNSSSLNSDALVGFNASTGTTYFFQIDSVDATGGDVTITLTDALWQYPTNDEVTSSPAIGADGTVYVGSADGFLHAVAGDGTLRWRGATGSAIDLASPAVGSDGTVYVGSTDGFLYAFNGATGARRWRFAPGSEIASAPALAGDGTIYFRDDRALHALTGNASSATRKWSFPLSGATYSSPAISLDGTIYVGATGGALYAVTPEGTQKWRFSADDDIYASPAIAADGTVYFATLSGSVYALTTGGAQKWRWRIASATNGITSSPAIGRDGSIYFAAYDRKLYALRSDGTEKWSFTAGGEVRASSPAIGADGTVYFGAYDGRLYAVKNDGTLFRHYATAARVRSSPLLANGRLYFGSNDGKLYAFNVGQGPAVSSWPMYRQNSSRTARAVSGVLSIAAQPSSQAARAGTALTLQVTATGDPAATYQWFKDGLAIAGATSAIYSVPSVTPATAGSYTVVVTGVLGSVTSAAAIVSVEAANVGRLVNLSVRAPAGTGAQTLIVGFAVDGASTLLIRGIGPALGDYGVSGVLGDPQVVLYSSGGVALQRNDNWSGDASLATAFTSVGAFGLNAASKDAALLRNVVADSYTAQITSATGDTGAALAEIYDANPTGGGRLVNLSARAQVTADTDPLIAGFVISGNVPKQVLIRATGPALAVFGVIDVLNDPRLALYRDSALVQSNDNWGGSAALTAAFAQVGAFAINDPASSDAVILATLPPGAYTAQVSAGNSLGGVALIEVYEVP
ncbi:MAG: PQQ-binding-like beta-propeller repeat protein [Verrucomicrobia bacterium]|nr:PQQ-binding-like beta-propeller repeat protein [Verrucomicrobiota bacterium]